MQPFSLPTVFQIHSNQCLCLLSGVHAHRRRGWQGPGEQQLLLLRHLDAADLRAAGHPPLHPLVGPARPGLRLLHPQAGLIRVLVRIHQSIRADLSMISSKIWQDLKLNFGQI